MYHGAVFEERGIEMLIRLLTLCGDYRLVILGNGQQDYIDGLQTLGREFGVDARMLILPAVPLDELWKYAGAADVEMCCVRAAWLSYYYSLPNKLFESIQAQRPVILSNFPVMSAFINKYGVGMVCDPEDIDDVYNCVERMRTDSGFYDSCRQNTIVAKEELCWENERKVLEGAYGELLA